MMKLRNSLVLALVLRVLYATSLLLYTQDLASFETPDTQGYLMLAENLINPGCFCNDKGIELFRPPGYPLFLASGVAVGNFHIWTMALQIGLGVLTVYLVYLLALRFGNPQAAEWGAFVFALEPVSIAYSSNLLSEGLLAFTLILAVLLLLQVLKNYSLTKLIVAALAVASLTYIKVIAYFLPLAIGAILLMMGLRSRGNPLIKSGMIFLIACALAILPWHLRNLYVADYGGFSTQIDRGLYFLAATSVEGDRKGISLNESRRNSEEKFETILETSKGTQEWGRSIRNEGISVLVTSPLRTLKVLSLGAAASLLDPAAGLFFRQFGLEPTGFANAVRTQGYFAIFGSLSKMPFPRLALIGFLALLVSSQCVLACVGVVALMRNHPSIVFILLVVIAYFLILSGSFGTHRFRVPLIPIFCCFIGYGIISMFSSIRRCPARC